MTGRLATTALTLLAFALMSTAVCHGELSEQSQNNPPALEEIPPTSPTATEPPPKTQTKEKLARVWANEPPLVRLARDKFGAEFTETDAKFFAAVAANDWADLRTSTDTKFDPEEPTTWATSPRLKADRLSWLCTDSAATKLVPSHGVWLRGVVISGRVELYRSDIPFSLTFYDCLFTGGLNIAHAKMQELDIRNCCSNSIQARAVQIAENVYLLTSSVFGGLDFIDANIGGDFDFSGGHAYQGMKDDEAKQGVAVNFHDAKVAGDIKLGDKFHAIGQVRLIGSQIGRSLTCGGGKFDGGEQAAIDARRSTIGANAVFTTGFKADGSVEMRRTHIGGDLDCDGGRFLGGTDGDALSADLVVVGGQVRIGNGFHAEGEVRLINATVEGDIDCDNGHFINPTGNALTLDGAVVGRSLRIGAENDASTDETTDLPTGYLSRGTLRLWGTQIKQDILASGGQFDAPTSSAILASDMKVASRVDLSSITAKGTVNLFSADIEHELDLRGSQFDGREAYGTIAIWANGMHVRGHVYCNQFDDANQQPHKFRVQGFTSFQFATISMHWDLYGAELINPAGDALDASDCRVGGYINLDTVAIDGRASFSRAKIDGMWILNKIVEPQKMRLDMRFAHIWVIKDERLEDWPPSGQLQLEGLVYDHFDDDSPLDVNDRLTWLRRQYAPSKAHEKHGTGVATIEHNRVEQRVAGQKVITGVERQRTSSSSTVLNQSSNDRYALATTPTTTHAANSRVVIPTNFEATATQMTPPAPTMIAPQRVEPSQPLPIKPPTETIGQQDSKSASPIPTGGIAAPASTVTKDGATVDITTAKVAATDSDQTATETTAAPDPSGRRYITQPYTQLASVYRAIGQDEQANTVLVARAQRIGELAPPFSAQGLWYGYLGRLIGYGYEPFRAIKIGLVIIAIGAIIFSIGARRHLMAETKLAEQVLSGEGQTGQVSSTYPRFNAIIYSLDVFLPFVDLNQVCYWIPGEKPSKPRISRNCLMHIGPYSLKWSAVLHCYLWFQTLAGWTLCTLLAAAVTGIVQS